jgi:rhodanese-related sulfurtransferase
MNRFILALSFLFAFISLSSAADTSIAHVDAKGAAKLIDQKSVVVLDVRTAGEFSDGHIEGAQNIDFTEDSFKTKVAALDKSKSYLVHCASGGRSTKSLETFKKLGFASITHLDGGFNAWKAAGQKVAK